MPRVTLGKGFAECIWGFAECHRHSAKSLSPVVNVEIGMTACVEIHKNADKLGLLVFTYLKLSNK